MIAAQVISLDRWLFLGQPRDTIPDDVHQELEDHQARDDDRREAGTDEGLLAGDGAVGRLHTARGEEDGGQPREEQGRDIDDVVEEIAVHYLLHCGKS